MRLKKGWRFLLMVLSLALLLTLIIVMLASLIPEPPLKEMQYARKMLAEAEKNNAAKYSNSLFVESKKLYDSAMLSWQKENKRFVFFRNFDETVSFADLSAGKSEEAIRNSKARSSILEVYLKNRIDSLNTIIINLDKLFISYPLSNDIRKRISHGKLMLKEGEMDYNKGEYHQAEQKIKNAGNLLVSSFKQANSDLEEYFKSYPLWKNLADRAIKESRQNSDYIILVDKFSRKCLIYLGGKKKYEFTIELGNNWVGHKRVKGDKATPEGKYRVIKKIGANRSKYYKALLLDYPNARDREEFRQQIKLGTLPTSSVIGGQIEIHGNGGKGIDWTDGCIALTDSDMDVVFKIAEIGTPVTIVGSLFDLNSVIKK